MLEQELVYLPGAVGATKVSERVRLRQSKRNPLDSQFFRRFSPGLLEKESSQID
jgi:hypothetical protein